VGRLRGWYRRGACRGGGAGPSPRNLDSFDTKTLNQEQGYVASGRAILSGADRAQRPKPSAQRRLHPLALRIMHWINATAIVIMIGSGWKIYNDDIIWTTSFDGRSDL
jgi:hypothetical protein